ncbi:MAG TPA: hypothetical protein VGJ31_03565, partial [Dongiaceae bacterium]
VCHSGLQKLQSHEIGEPADCRGKPRFRQQASQPPGDRELARIQDRSRGQTDSTTNPEGGTSDQKGIGGLKQPAEINRLNCLKRNKAGAEKCTSPLTAILLIRRHRKSIRSPAGWFQQDERVAGVPSRV